MSNEADIYVDEPEEDRTESNDVDKITEPKPDTSVKEKKLSPVKRRRQYVKVTQDINSAVKLTSGDEIVLPSNFDEETRSLLNDSPNVDLTDNPESRSWLEDLATGLDINTHKELFVKTLENPDATFSDSNEHNGVSLDGKSPKFKSVENQNLKGERAVIRFISHLGLGSLFQVPLWHSGLWVTIKPPTESEIIELNRQMISDKIQFGRYTYGLAYSNISVYTTNRLVDFVLAHTYHTSAKSEVTDNINIKDIISCQDIPALLWGLVCTMYPKGFRYRRACINHPDKCQYILEETLNVTKLMYSNTAALTDRQKAYMSNRQANVRSLEEIDAYKEELSILGPKKIFINKDLSNEISLTLKTPSISDYINGGYKWITGIVDKVDQVLQTEPNAEERNNFITKHGQATSMHQYSHWVTSIEYDSNIIDDRETIDKTLDVISADDGVRSEFITAVVDYINSSTMSVIGIPSYDCPSDACKVDQGTDPINDDFSNILPLDVMQLFFALLTQRLSRLVER